jgi:chromate transporter
MTLPGPTSTEFAISIGAYRAGVLGACVSFLSWSLPSFAVMLAVRWVHTHPRLQSCTHT